MKPDLHMLFADHCDLILNEIRHALKKPRTLEGRKFCIDDLRTQDDVIKLVKEQRDYFIAKLKYRRFTSLKMIYVQIQNATALEHCGQFRILLDQ